LKLTRKNTIVAGASMLAAATLVSAGVAGQGGNSAAAAGVRVAPSTPVAPSGAEGTSHNIVAISPQGADTELYTVSSAGGTVTSYGGVGVAFGSGMSRQPGTRSYYISTGNNDGGNIYIARLGSSALVGASGYPNVSGLAWNPAGSALYGTATGFVLSDQLVEIDPGTGAATPVGTGMGIGGIDSIAFNPADGVLYASTGFFYDGSPGDKLTINPATGVASDSGADMSPAPACTVSGMAFASDGTGYVSVGCGGTGGAGGDIHSWNVTTNQISLVANPTGGPSVSDIEVN